MCQPWVLALLASLQAPLMPAMSGVLPYIHFMLLHPEGHLAYKRFRQ